MTHTLRLLCKFSRANDAVCPSSLKLTCFRLSVPGILASFHKVKTDSDRYAGMTSSCPVYGLETHIKPHQFLGVFDRTMVSGCQNAGCGGPLPGFGS